ncbi:MAG: serpin family protein [Verrucomicrobiae bacterium]|nr:serpin family protein [Verrucomicrobiae bacterium]
MLANQPAQPSAPSNKPFRIGLGQLLGMGLLFELILVLLFFVTSYSGWLFGLANYVHMAHRALLIAIMIFPLGEGLVGLVIWLFLVGFAWLMLLGAVFALALYAVEQPVKWLVARCGVTARTKTVLARGVLGLGAVAIVGSIVYWAVNARATSFTPSADVEAAVSANTAFAVDLYHTLESKSGNLFFSPFSISCGIAMAYAGARGETATEMAKALHFDLPHEKLHPAFGALVRRMNKLQRWGRVQLATANSLWCQKGYGFTNTFLELVREFYGAEARHVDFIQAPDAAANEVNHWVARKTKRKITGAVRPGTFTPLTRMVLCNAIYFKGKWLHQFKERDTKPAPFYVSPDKTVTVPMMYQDSDFKTALSQDGLVHMLEMPYAGEHLSMVVLLPSTENADDDAEKPSLTNLERMLTPENLKAWLSKLDEAAPRKTSVYFPRFTMTHAFNLRGPLQELGVTSAFGPGADFSGIDGTTNLFVSDMLHNAFVEVNEAGTEAGAAIQIFVTAGQARRFKADRPFIFLIRDNASGSILFMGRVVDPTEN